MIEFLKKLLGIRTYEENLIHNYFRAGLSFGEAVSYLTIAGPCSDYDKRELLFNQLEEEYVRMGYKKIPFDKFIEAGGYTNSLAIVHLLGIKDE